MRHLRLQWNSKIDFFNDPEFFNFKRSLDSEMKRLQSKGLGAKIRQAQTLTVEDEEKLWSSGVLGDSNPKQLLDTIIFCNGLYFALRSGQEHRQLRFAQCQIQLVEKEHERPYLKYTEDISKNRPGGLKGRKLKLKEVCHYANLENTKRCFVRLFKKYVSLCPPSAKAFYVQPLSKPSETCWYSSNPVGHHTITKTMRRICESVGIEGFITNHSLRATAATRLYEAGVSEQLIMEHTGHRSLEGVRSYKRSTTGQKQSVSDILNLATTSVAATSSPVQTTQKEYGTLAYRKFPDHLASQKVHPAETSIEPEALPVVQTLSSSQICLNTSNTNIENILSRPGTFTLNSCTGITFNIHYHQ